MAVAERLPDDIEPILFTLSSALPIPVAAGLRVEHLASAGYVDIKPSDWHELLEDRVEQLLAHYRPQVVVFDGVHPYRGLTNALGRNRRRIHRMWMRRGMWKPGVGEQTVALASHFDDVIEPGEFASEYDLGAPANDRARTIEVDPVCYPGPEPRLARRPACERLGLDPDEVNVLVQLGAGTINDIESVSGAVVATLLERGAHPVAARSVLSAGDDLAVDGVTVIRKFPLTPWFDAFDAAVIATGYNSFHECLSLGMPTLMIPNMHTRTDDQDARSRWADDQRLGIRWDGSDTQALPDAVSRLLDADNRSLIRDALESLPPADGAQQVATYIEELLR